MAIVITAGSEDDVDGVAGAMRATVGADASWCGARPRRGQPVIWFVLAMQCMSTLAIVRRETGAGAGRSACSST